MTDAPAPVPPQPAYGQVPQAPYVPSAPASHAPKSVPQAVWRGAVGVLLIVAGVLCQVAGAGFPSNAPVEMFANFAITVTAIVAGVLLLVFAFLAAFLPSLPLSSWAVSPLALTAAVLGALGVIAWLLVVPGTLIQSGADGDRLRYGVLSGPTALTGFLWATAIVMGAIAFRSPRLGSRTLGAIAIVLGFGMIAANIWAAAIYSAGITD